MRKAYALPPSVVRPKIISTDRIELWTTRFLAHLASERRVSSHTVAAYRIDLAQLTAFVGRRAVAAYGVEALRAWFEHLTTAGIAPSSRQRKHGALRTFFRYLLAQRVIVRDPTARLRSPKQRQRLPRPLSAADLHALLEAMATAKVPRRRRALARALQLRNVAIVEVLYGSGIRVSELAALDLEDVDFERGVVRVRGKGQKERVVPLGRTAARALRAYLRVRKSLLRTARSEAVFVSGRLGRAGRRVQPRAIQILLARLRPGLHPHALRHAFASHMLARGAEIRVIQELLGHATMATTQRYTRVTKKELIAAHRAALGLAYGGQQLALPLGPL